MSHPLITRMHAAIVEVERRFMVQRGLRPPVPTVPDPIAKLAQRLNERAFLLAMASECHILRVWKRKPRSFHTLATGEVIQYGPGRAHSVREPKTTYLRRQWTERDVSYLQRCISASRPISAEEANTILRTIKPNLPRPKRSPIEALPDDIDMSWKSRPALSLNAEALIRSQLSHNPKLMARELARIGKR